MLQIIEGSIRNITSSTTVAHASISPWGFSGMSARISDNRQAAGNLLVPGTAYGLCDLQGQNTRTKNPSKPLNTCAT